MRDLHQGVELGIWARDQAGLTVDNSELVSVLSQ